MVQNYDNTSIVTPVNIPELQRLLQTTGYDEGKSRFLIEGFSQGFDLGYRGPEQIQIRSPNLKFTIGSRTELWNKVMKEVECKRYAGPYRDIPFQNYIQSPIGLVPKDNGMKTRLIFHLSYPKTGSTSVNFNTPQELCTVKYKDFDEAVKLCTQVMHGADPGAAKSDLTSAFRHLPIKRSFWKFLVMKAQCPLDKNWYYFFDKNLPFGSSRSCAIFQAFSDGLAHIVKTRTGSENVNYLDDFFFIAELMRRCNWQVQKFIEICALINFPVSQEKTVMASKYIVFLGLLIDLCNMRVSLPIEKVEKAKNLIAGMIAKKKTTLRGLQQLTGFLNFLSKAIIPGRTFTRRLYSLQSSTNVTKPHHHIDLNSEARLDLKVWLQFLQQPGSYSRSFFNFNNRITYTPQFFYTDASGNMNLGCGGVCDSEWFALQWKEDFIRKKKPSINYLELYALSIGILSWTHRYGNQPITIFCDNMSVVYMVNNGTSRCKNCMVLLRLITLHCMIHNVEIFVEYINTKFNKYADFLSRMQYQEFRKLARKENRYFKGRPIDIPDILTPIEKIWLD